MLDHAIPILRALVLVVWSLIALWAMPSYRRALTRGAATEDWRQVAFAAVGIAIIAYQLRGLSRGKGYPIDSWSAPLLILLASAGAVVIFLVHLPRTPVGHRRAVAGAYLGMLAACIVGGIIA